jgi:hypothetical protein
LLERIIPNQAAEQEFSAASLGLLVVTLAGNRASAITRFDQSVLTHFGLPRTLPG